MSFFASIYVLCLVRLVSAGNGDSDDFSSNLFSDIAPLIALFGEQLAQQYLSQSLGWLENVLFACAPLGIITTVTCSIRVGGAVALRALIGRSQERAVQVELDLLTSTSSDICELWDGNQIVRLAGSPKILELVYDEDGNIFTRDEAMKLSTEVPSSSWSRALPWNKPQVDVTVVELVESQQQLIADDDAAPNIKLNVAPRHKSEIRVFTSFAVLIQTGVLVFDVFSAYNYKLSTGIDKDKIPSVGLPITFAGTLAVSIGVFLCAYVIQSRTRHARWVSKNGQKVRIMWLQKSQVLGDHHFGSCAIFADQNRHEIVTSRADDKRDLTYWSWIGTGITAAGFICQLIGLRTMHWPSAVAQFIATILMTVVRVWVRRHASRRPIVRKLDGTGVDTNSTNEDANSDNFTVFELGEGQELNEVCKKVSGCYEWYVCTGHLLHKEKFVMAKEAEGQPPIVSHLLSNRNRLRELWGSSSSGVDVMTGTVAAVLTGLMGFILTPYREKPFEYRLPVVPPWTLKLAVSGPGFSTLFDLEIPLRLTRHDGEVKISRKMMEAILSMWLSHLRASGVPNTGNNLWLLAFEDDDEWKLVESILDFTIFDLKKGWFEVSDLAETCRTHDIHPMRVLLSSRTDSKNGDLKKKKLIGIVSQTNLEQMCIQYMFASFISQMATIAGAQPHRLPLGAESEKAELHLLNHFPGFMRSVGGQGIFASVEDAKIIAFCGIIAAGQLKDPFPIVPDILSIAVAFEKGKLKSPSSTMTSLTQGGATERDNGYQAASLICDKLRLLYQRKANVMTKTRPLDEILELGITLNGHFVRAFTVHHDEVPKTRSFVFDVVESIRSRLHSDGAELQPPSASPTTAQQTAAAPRPTPASDESTAQSAQPDTPAQLPPVENTNPAAAPPSTSPDPPRELDEQSIIAAVSAGDVDTIKRFLVTPPTDLQLHSQCIARALQAAQHGERTFETAEIARLLMLAGIDYNRPLKWLSFGAASGNVALVEYLFGNTAQAKEFSFAENMTDPLFAAIRNGHGDMAKWLLDRGADVDRTEKGVSALHIAAANNREDIVKMLLDRGAKLDAYSVMLGGTALSAAARSGYNSIGKMLITAEKEATKNRGRVGFHFEDDKDTALHAVAECGNLELVKEVLDAGWDINGGKSKQTPLYGAINGGHVKVAALLIEQGSRLDPELMHACARRGLTETAKELVLRGLDVNASVEHEDAPILQAIEKSRYPVRTFAFVKFLVENGADMNAKNSGGRNLLINASIWEFEDVCVLLVNRGCSLDGRGGSRHGTIVHHATEHGQLNLLRLIVEKGVDVTATEHGGRTALHIAAEKGRADILKILLDAKKGPWIDTVSDKYSLSWTALHDAVGNGHIDAAKVLLENGASTAIVAEGTTALSRAVSQDQIEMIKLLVSHNAPFDYGLIKNTLYRGRLGTIRALLANDKANTAAGETSKCTKALSALLDVDPLAQPDVVQPKAEVIELLLELGADPSYNKGLDRAIQRRRHSYVRAMLSHMEPAFAAAKRAELFISAAWENDVRTIRMWLAAGVPVTTLNQGGATALHVAAKATGMETVAVLLEQDKGPAFLDIQSASGATALFSAVRGSSRWQRSKCLEVVKALVEAGADPSLRGQAQGVLLKDATTPGKTPLEVAEEKQLTEVVEYLKALGDKQ